MQSTCWVQRNLRTPLHLFHQHSPLVHCMTNDVVQTFTANTLLALGASPAMVIETERGQSVCGYRQCLVD